MATHELQVVCRVHRTTSIAGTEGVDLRMKLKYCFKIWHIIERSGKIFMNGEQTGTYKEAT